MQVHMFQVICEDTCMNVSMHADVLAIYTGKRPKPLRHALLRTEDISVCKQPSGMTQ